MNAQLKKDLEKVKMRCPNCEEDTYILEEHAYRKNIDGVKCSACFRDRSTFVNLKIAPIDNRFEILDL